MEIFRKVADMQAFAKKTVREGKKIALVPTMGFLHEGHLSLIDRACAEADVVIVSIFVNPTQFGPTEDLDKYPRDFQRDKDLCEVHGASAIFAPEPEEMYASDRSIWVDEEKLSKKLCGKSRPIHFRGVCTVVSKLFNICLPDVAIFGQKDAQQALIIKRMVRDLNFPVEIIVSPLIREASGLALSSRNKYLTDEQKNDALSLSRSLNMAKELISQKGLCACDEAVKMMRDEITKCHGEIDYVECLDSNTLEAPVENTTEILIAVAVKFGTTRLIDNVLLGV
ncbi:MAG: pantoate--beta-alanine ligase [Lentisphaeria bacterium]|nr:pantoate--beta-alanine ligase [Lentisphaeria bacterium]